MKSVAMSWGNIGVIMDEIGQPILVDKIFNKSIELWEIFKNNQPKNHIIKYNLGVLFEKKGQINKAKLLLKEAIAINNKFIGSWIVLGQIYLDIGDYENSLIVYEKLTKLDKGKNSWLYWGNLGLSQNSLGFKEKAIGSYKKSISLNKNNKVSWHNKANILYDRGEMQEAIKNYRIVISLDSGYVDAWFNMAKAYSEIGNNIEAIKSYKWVTKINENFHDAWVNLGYSFKEIGSLRKAEQAYLKAFQINKNSPYTLNNLGVLYLLKNENKKAIHFFRKSILSMPNNDETAEMIEEIERINSKLYIKFIQLGWLNILSKQVEKAQNNFHKVLDLTNNSYAYIGLGHCQLILSNKEEAIKNYQKSLGLWNCSEEFFKDFDEDFQYIKSQNISKEYYQSIKQKLRDYCYNKKGVIKL